MPEDLIQFIDDLRNLPAETEWLEFKASHQTSERIGEYISALSNSACLHQKSEAYLVFGVENNTHNIVGTTFDPYTTKGKGAEDLIPWLQRLLSPAIDFTFTEINHPKGRVVILFIQPAYSGPVKFSGKKWIRIGSSKKGLDEVPGKEAVIWDRRVSFEKKVAKENVSEAEVLKLLNYDKYFQLSGFKNPEGQDEIIKILLHEGFVLQKSGRFHISNLGAILLARDLSGFPNLYGKAVRIITYKGINKLNAVKDITYQEGYSVCFEKLVNYIQSQIPEPERIEGAIRTSTPGYPLKSIREFAANALIHQDFSMTGSPPLIEIFENRIEIANQGTPLIEPNRFIDLPSKARNELLTDALRIMKICERRGSGVDRAMHAIEVSQLPPPKIESGEDGASVKVTIYSHKELRLLTKEEQCRACYFHSCIRRVVDNETLTNASLCARLAIDDKNKAIASRIIKETTRKGWIKKFDPENKSNRYAQYVPFWA